MVRTVPYEGTEAGSAPVASTTGHEKSALTRDDKISGKILRIHMGIAQVAQKGQLSVGIVLRV